MEMGEEGDYITDTIATLSTPESFMHSDGQR